MFGVVAAGDVAMVYAVVGVVGFDIDDCVVDGIAGGGGDEVEVVLWCFFLAAGKEEG